MSERQKYGGETYGAADGAVSDSSVPTAGDGRAPEASAAQGCLAGCSGLGSFVGAVLVAFSAWGLLQMCASGGSTCTENFMYGSVIGALIVGVGALVLSALGWAAWLNARHRSGPPDE